MVNSRGFTLPEMLIGLLIFTVMVTSVYFNFHAALSLYKRADVSDVSIYEMQLVFDRMERDIHNMVRLDDMPFQGDKSHIEFPAYIDMYQKGQAYRELCHVRYYVKNATLYRMVKVLSRGTKPGLKDRDDAFLFDAHALRFSFSHTNPRKEIVWKDTWKQEEDGVFADESEGVAVNAVPHGIRMTWDRGQEKGAGEKKQGQVYAPVTKTFFVPIGEWREEKLSA